MGRNFFPQILAPKKRNPPRFQLEMAASVDELKTTMQFVGFQDMMSTALDKLGALETWKETADGSLGTLLQKTTATVTRVEVSRRQRRMFPTSSFILHHHRCPRLHLTGARSTICHQLRRVSTSTRLPERHQV